MPHLNSSGGSSKSNVNGGNMFCWIKINKSMAVFAAMPIWLGSNVTSQCSNNNNRVSGQELCCFCHVPVSASATGSSSAASRQLCFRTTLPSAPHLCHRAPEHRLCHQLISQDLPNLISSRRWWFENQSGSFSVFSPLLFYSGWNSKGSPVFQECVPAPGDKAPYFTGRRSLTVCWRARPVPILAGKTQHTVRIYTPLHILFSSFQFPPHTEDGKSVEKIEKSHKCGR